MRFDWGTISGVHPTEEGVYPLLEGEQHYFTCHPIDDGTTREARDSDKGVPLSMENSVSLADGD